MGNLTFKQHVQNLLDKLFSSETRFTWYDAFFENRYNKSHPEKIMEQKTASDYYSKEWNRIEQCKKWLSDEKSKKIYENLIRFLMTGNRKFHRRCELPQYFPNDIVKLNNNEVFIDCGGYIGDTTLEFVSRVGGGTKI